MARDNIYAVPSGVQRPSRGYVLGCSGQRLVVFGKRYGAVECSKQLVVKVQYLCDGLLR